MEFNTQQLLTEMSVFSYLLDLVDLPGGGGEGLLIRGQICRIKRHMSMIFSASKALEPGRGAPTRAVCGGVGTCAA